VGRTVVGEALTVSPPPHRNPELIRRPDVECNGGDFIGHGFARVAPALGRSGARQRRIVFEAVGVQRHREKPRLRR
jgi:hypothetical protein